MSTFFAIILGISDSSFRISHLFPFFPYSLFQVMTFFPSPWTVWDHLSHPAAITSSPPPCNHVLRPASRLCGHTLSFHVGTRFHLPVFTYLRTLLWKFSSPASFLVSVNHFHQHNNNNDHTFTLLIILLCTAVH